MTERVLIVDDEPFVRQLVRDTLEKKGFTTGIAADGEEALALLDEEDFGVVLTDVVMPGMDGFELLKRIKKRHPGTKVVILTGYARQQQISEFYLHGADEYLAKPFQVHELIGVLERLVAGPESEEE